VSLSDTAVRFQALPPLSPDEYAALEKSILDHGVLMPILVDEHGVVIDGHHRQKIAREHDLPCPTEIKAGFTDTEKRTMALSLNIDRRHLTRDQRTALVAESLKADPELSDRQHGGRAGVDHKTVGKVRRDLEATGEIPQSDVRVSADGRSRPASQPPRPDSEPWSEYFDDDQEAADALAMADLSDDEFESVLTDARAQEDLSRENVAELCRERKKPRRGPLPDTARTVTIELGRMNKRLEKLLADDRFDRNREVIGNMIRPQVAHGLKILDRIDTAINPSKPKPAEQAQPQIGPDYIDNILPLFLQTFGPHRLEQFDASERRRVIDAMKEALQKLEELEMSGGDAQ